MRRPASAGSSARSRDCAPLCAIERRRGRRAETVHFAVLEQVVSARTDTERPSAPSADDPEVLDADALLGRVNGNQAAVAEIIAIFRAGSGEMLRAIDAALSAWDAEALEHAAHRLKGALMALAAPAASRAALRLEDIARERDLRLAADARAALARMLARLEPQLDALAPGEPGGGRRSREPALRTGG